MFMIGSYMLYRGIGDAGIIFSAPERMSLKKLLDTLGLKKGEGGAELQLATDQVRRGNELFPSSFLLLPPQGQGKLKVVGTLATRYAECRDFAISASEPHLIATAETFATFLVRIEEATWDRKLDEYETLALVRCDQRSRL